MGCSSSGSALPLYAIFGMSVDGVRLTHMVFAMGVLVCGARCCSGARRCRCGSQRSRGSRLAIDPTFVFAFRTQSYITMSPVAWLLLSLAALGRCRERGAPLSIRHYFASGVCFGFAVLGYFVYAFYLPAMLLWMLGMARAAANRSPRRTRAESMRPGGLRAWSSDAPITFWAIRS